MLDCAEAFAQIVDGACYFGMFTDGAVFHPLNCTFWTARVSVESPDDVVAILVLLSLPQGERLEHDERQEIRNVNEHPLPQPAVIQSLAVERDGERIQSSKFSSRCSYRSNLRSDTVAGVA